MKKLPSIGYAAMAVLACAVAAPASAAKTVHVSGTGVDLLNGAIVHSKQKTSTGLVERSTEIVELNGDLHGKVLYDVTSIIDEKAGTMVNSGNQVFSGTVIGLGPVMLADSRFRFYVNFKTGKDRGDVYLTRHIAGPPASCTLRVIGTGRRADGNPTFKYSGTCTL